jgi:hypothetical protein
MTSAAGTIRQENPLSHPFIAFGSSPDASADLLRKPPGSG